MASITIRNLDEQTKRRLRIRAAENNHSMEEEARLILSAALLPAASNLAETIRKRFEPLGGVDLELPRRGEIRKPPRPR